MFNPFGTTNKSEETNTEYTDDELRTKLTHGLGDQIIEYLNTSYLDKTYGTASYSDTQIRSFISAIFNLLSKGNVCFSAGTIVFSDLGKLMFNLLTYNKLRIENNTYRCDDPKKNIRGDNVISSPQVTVKSTHKTHNKIFSSGKGKSIACLPKSQTKFERAINPPLEGLCDEPTSIEQKSESKSVLLYYPFKAEDDKQFLFFKLERDEIISTGHIKKAVATYVGNRIDGFLGKSTPLFGVNEIPNHGIDTVTGFDMRREDRSSDKNPNECDYSNFFYRKDVIFYENYYKILNIARPSDFIIQNNLAELEWYNTNIRTGCEFYVTSFLLFDMLKKLFVPKQAINLIHLGGNKKFRSKKQNYKKRDKGKRMKNGKTQNKGKKQNKSKKMRRSRKIRGKLSRKIKKH